MLRVGLTGGIASGKSTISALLAEHGALVIDSDLLAREVVAAGTPGLADVLVAFGPDVLTDEGHLDRAAMGRRVFGDEPARRRLEAIVHPRVRARAAEIEAVAPSDAVVVHDIPLLVETGQGAEFDVVVVVDVPIEVQVTRLIGQRDMDADEAQTRIAAQVGRDERLAVATHVLRNDGTLEQLRAAVDDLWSGLAREAHTRKRPPT
jgi:dephospho-CoA kinase